MTSTTATAGKIHPYCTDVWLDEALRFIGESPAGPPRQPFFVYLLLNAMHHPFRVTDAFADPYRLQEFLEERTRFYGMIANFDVNFGRLLTTLRDRGLEDNTLVIIMGDNGTAAASDRSSESPPLFNAGMREVIGSVYEGGHLLCCWARRPAGLSGGGPQVYGLAAHFDWMLTLVDFCGLRVPNTVRFDDRSLRPLLKQGEATWSDRTIVISRKPAEITPANRAPFAVLTTDWRLVNRELYAIKTDPEQQDNVAARHPDVVQRLTAAYREWRDDVARAHAEVARFLVGDARENPTRFTARNWFPAEGRAIQQPEQIADDVLFP